MSSQTSGMLKKAKKTWQNIKSRCTNPNTPYYYKYGGKGVTVCNEWLDSFDNFLRDMGFPPSSLHTIDRIDSSKGYNKVNCRWASYSEQNYNRRRKNKYGFRGISFMKNRKNPWLAQITIDGDRLNLGYFSSPEEAAREYDKASLFYLKEFAILNFPKESISC